MNSTTVAAAAVLVARAATPAAASSLEALAIGVARRRHASVFSALASRAATCCSSRWGTQPNLFVIPALAQSGSSASAASLARRSTTHSFASSSSSFSSCSSTSLDHQLRRQHSDAASTSTSASQPLSAAQQQRDGLRLTQAAVERVRFLLEKRKQKGKEKDKQGGDDETTTTPSAAVLRLTVEAGGCSGFSYVFSLDDAGPRRGDQLFGEEGKVVEDGGGKEEEGGSSPAALLAVDPVSFDLVKGATVDFEQELIKAGFEVVDNPNAEAGCGCGSSFAAKSF